MIKLELLMVIFSACSIGMSDGTVTCLTCYSPELMYMWPITGLNILPPPNKDQTTDKRWNDLCAACDGKCYPDSSPTAAPTFVGAGIYEQCEDFCVEFFITDPALANSGGQRGKYAVRGCHATLTGINDVKPVWKGTAGTDEKLCQSGNPTMWSDALGTEAVYKQALTFCNSMTNMVADKSFKACNTNAYAATFCSPTDYDSSKVLKKCQTCTSKKNCIGEAKETDAAAYSAIQYCMKSYAKLDGKREYSKAPGVNIYGDSRCVKMEYKLPMTTRRLVEYKATRCYCNTENCNGAATITTKFIIPLLSIIKIVQITL